MQKFGTISLRPEDRAYIEDAIRHVDEITAAFSSGAKWRLAGRAVLAGVVVFASTLLQAPGAWDRSLIEAAAVSALWAAVEVYTPLNALVGKWKPKA